MWVIVLISHGSRRNQHDPDSYREGHGKSQTCAAKYQLSLRFSHPDGYRENMVGTTDILGARQVANLRQIIAKPCA